MALLRFGVFELDAEIGELRRQGRLVRLTGQPLKALHLLVSRPGDLVTRDELRRHIWSDARFVDFDRSLNFCIAAVRDALGDNARSPRFVETLPRRGYRFIADVRLVTDASPLATPSAAIAPATGLRWLAVAAVMPILLLQGSRSNPAHTRATASPAALAAFDEGVAARHQGDEGWRRSIHRFGEATRLDPMFAEAHYALADVYLDLAGSRALPPEAALAQAKAAAQYAIALEDVAPTRTVLGMTRLLEDWDWSGARRDLERSIRLAPNHDGSLVAYARLLSAWGDDGGAIATIDRAEAVSPSCDLVYWESALIRYRAHRSAEALAKARIATELGPPGNVEPAEWRSRLAWLRVLIHADRHEWTDAEAEVGMIAGIDAGRTPDLRTFVERTAESASRVSESARRPVWIATLHAIAGHDEAALTWMERAVAERDPDVVFGLRDPAFDRVRREPRFERLLRETGRLRPRTSIVARLRRLIPLPALASPLWAARMATRVAPGTGGAVRQR